ncbi:MAG: aspartate carbamoyltransferase regulatory subunit [Prolixibacteraceae bacterium]|nr:aspartate carbamoyltransferase regulatory subunit [Prolixibacteraceae bacterium]MBN2649037.1 aspartate carbamoyltransferase regulatory subunit [Prolixibacteraceae bacterium]
MDKALQVSAIKDGTVIDHIPAERLFDVINILELDTCRDMITFGMNLDSFRMGKKAIIKVANRFFQGQEINKIALIAPNAKLNTIKNYHVVEKRVVEIPSEITNIVKCFNPKCITNHEAITTRFKVISKKPIELRCMYCEKITSEKQVVIR